MIGRIVYVMGGYKIKKKKKKRKKKHGNGKK